MANDPQKTEKGDPQAWSPVVQQWEAFKAMKELISAPHEQVLESVLRNILSWQYDIKPEEVTWGTSPAGWLRAVSSVWRCYNRSEWPRCRSISEAGNR